jgi:hypothetical protein
MEEDEFLAMEWRAILGNCRFWQLEETMPPTPSGYLVPGTAPARLKPN